MIYWFSVLNLVSYARTQLYNLSTHNTDIRSGTIVRECKKGTGKRVASGNDAGAVIEVLKQKTGNKPVWAFSIWDQFLRMELLENICRGKLLFYLWGLG